MKTNLLGAKVSVFQSYYHLSKLWSICCHQLPQRGRLKVQLSLGGFGNSKQHIAHWDNIIPRLIFQEKLNEWHGMDEESGPLKILRTKSLAQAQSSRLYILYFSDSRSHWVYRKSQYYQGGMRCCLMACLLKVLSDMLQNPQLPSHIHIWPKPKVKLCPTDSLYPAPPSFKCHSHCHKP